MTFVPVGLPPLCSCGEPWTRPRMETVSKAPYVWRVTWTCAAGHTDTVTLEEAK